MGRRVQSRNPTIMINLFKTWSDCTNLALLQAFSGLMSRAVLQDDNQMDGDSARTRKSRWKMHSIQRSSIFLICWVAGIESISAFADAIAPAFLSSVNVTCSSSLSPILRLVYMMGQWTTACSVSRQQKRTGWTGSPGIISSFMSCRTRRESGARQKAEVLACIYTSM